MAALRETAKLKGKPLPLARHPQRLLFLFSSSWTMSLFPPQSGTYLEVTAQTGASCYSIRLLAGLGFGHVLKGLRLQDEALAGLAVAGLGLGMEGVDG